MHSHSPPEGFQPTREERSLRERDSTSHSSWRGYERTAYSGGSVGRQVGNVGWDGSGISVGSGSKEPHSPRRHRGRSQGENESKEGESWEERKHAHRRPYQDDEQQK